MDTHRRASVMTTAAIATLLGACQIDLGFGLDGGWSIDLQEFKLNLTGIVTSAADGSPLPGVTVSQEDGPYGDPVLTDSLGLYSLTTNLHCSASNCKASHLFVAHLDGFERGFEPQWKDLGGRQQVIGQELTATLDFSLRPTRPITVTVQGQVSDSTGASIAGALITVWEGRSAFFGPVIIAGSTVADSLGVYEIETADHCAISGTSCFVSFRVKAQSGGPLEVRAFYDVNVSGDSLAFEVNFQNLR
jgi:hypothetical protein